MLAELSAAMLSAAMLSAAMLAELSVMMLVNSSAVLPYNLEQTSSFLGMIRWECYAAF